jgi:hypothetical protein
MAISDGKDLNQNVIRKPAGFANGGTISTPIFVGGQMIVGLDCGDALTGTTMAFLNSIDGGKTWRSVENENDGLAYSVTVEGGKYIHINPPLTGLDMVRLVSGTAEAATRTVTIIMVP